MVHIPPFSGLETEEQFRDPGMRDRLIGQGRPGEIVRNLLWYLWRQADEKPWMALVKDIEDLFGYTLLPPSTWPPGKPISSVSIVRETKGRTRPQTRYRQRGQRLPPGLVTVSLLLRPTSYDPAAG